MLEILFVAVIFLFALAAKNKHTLALMFLLLPLHGFIKAFVFADSGNIFALWKELCILVIFIKTLNSKERNENVNINRIKSSFIIFLCYILFFFYIGYVNGFSVAVDVRQFIFPSLLLISISRMQFSNADLKMILSSIFIGTIIVNISGILDFVSPVLRILMRTMMGAGFTVGDDGNIYYENSSMRIMGLDRVAGISSGGPNMMGVFNAIILIFAAIAYQLRFYYKKSEKIFLITICTMCAFCTLMSFSRAGWAIIVITFSILGYRDKKYRNTIIRLAFICSLLFVAAFYFIEQVHLIVSATFTGQEASSAARASMTQDSYSLLLQNPFGQGMGAANHDVEYYWSFAESTLINLGFCCGFLGILLYLIHILRIYKANIVRDILVCRYAAAFIIAYIIASAVSVNVVANPFVYYAWFMMGLGLARHEENY